MSVQFQVAGISFKKQNVYKVLKAWEKKCEDLPVSLVPEPTNQYDKNAIKVVVQGTDADGGICIGYVPKNLTNKIAPYLEIGNAFLLDIGVFSAGYYARINFISIPKAPTSELPSAEVWNMPRAPS